MTEKNLHKPIQWQVFMRESALRVTVELRTSKPRANVTLRGREVWCQTRMSHEKSAKYIQMPMQGSFLDYMFV
jgi:glycyl-tRNA synthetase (class II)